ncbi:Uncharacterised protein g3589 [Pycnogonum litorale]
MTTPLKNGCRDYWGWDKTDKSHEVKVYGANQSIAHFHPNWSHGTAAVRATRDLKSGRSYWEIKVSDRLFGTSMMFGIGTKKCRLHCDSFVNLLGEDCDSWGLSHKGVVWHDGKCKSYTKPFRENVSTTIGILYDDYDGTMTFFKDGVDLGVAFDDIRIDQELFPMVCSTAAKTEMTLLTMRRDFINLQDMCRNVILQNDAVIDNLATVPNRIKRYIREGRNKNYCRPSTSSTRQCCLKHKTPASIYEQIRSYLYV